jgi:transcriptional regulator with XRE-family HTH domain
MVYKSYQFIDKDPMIDFVRTVIQDSGWTLKRISEESDVNVQTISRWLYGDTKNPRASSVNAVLRAIDYKLDITKLYTPSIIKPTPYQPKHVNVTHMHDYHTRAKKVGKTK